MSAAAVGVTSSTVGPGGPVVNGMELETCMISRVCRVDWRSASVVFDALAPRVVFLEHDTFLNASVRQVKAVALVSQLSEYLTESLTKNKTTGPIGQFDDSVRTAEQ
jgi:hypothetical protein